MPNPIWDDLRRVADELEVQIQLAGMDARDRWRALQPRLTDLEKTIAREGDRAGKLVATELDAIGEALRKLLYDVSGTRAH